MVGRRAFPLGTAYFQGHLLWVLTIKNWMGPNPNGPPSKLLLELLDTQVFSGSVSIGSCCRFLGFQKVVISEPQKFGGFFRSPVSSPVIFNRHLVEPSKGGNFPPWKNWDSKEGPKSLGAQPYTPRKINMEDNRGIMEVSKIIFLSKWVMAVGSSR